MSPQPRIYRDRNSGPGRESFSYRVPAPQSSDGAERAMGMWVPAKSAIGSVLPQHSKPEMTVFSHSYDDVIAFSVLRITKAQRSKFVETEIKVPYGSLTRLVKRSRELNGTVKGDDTALVDPTNLRIEIEGSGDYDLVMTRDESNVVEIAMADGSDDVAWKSGKEAIRLSVFLLSPIRQRTLAISWTGFMEKPGLNVSVLQVAARALNSIRDLPEFQLLSGIEKVRTPDAGRFRRPSVSKAAFTMPAFLFTEEIHNNVAPDEALVASGLVEVEIDLEELNSKAGRFKYHFRPDESLSESWEPYSEAAATAVNEAMVASLGAEHIAGIQTDIVLSEVDEKLVEALKEAGKALGLALMLTPSVGMTAPAEV